MAASNNSSKAQAIDDTYSWTEDNLIVSGPLQGNVVSLDVVANDRTSGSTQLWSTDDPNATISNGKILYNLSASLAAFGATSVDALAAGDHIHTQFTYTIRNGNGNGSGALSQATVVIDLWGSNDAAHISGNATGNTVEDSSTTAGGLLSVADVDHGQNVFQSVSQAALVCTYGNFTFNQTSGAWGYALDHARADSLGYGEVVHDQLSVLSKDGTASRVIDVAVTGAIDAPVVTASAAQPSIKQGGAVGLNIAATDVDDSASLRYAITGVPDTAVLTSAADPGGVSYDAASHSWLVSAGALADLTLTPDAKFSGDIGLTVTVTNTEANPNNASDIATATATASISLTVNPYTLTYTWNTIQGPNADSTDAVGINNSNQVVGNYSDADGTHGFLFSGGHLTTLDVAPGTDTSATSINATGQIAGYFEDADGLHGFVYGNDTFTPFDPADSVFFLYVSSMNNAGDVVGYYFDNSGMHGFLYDGQNSIALDPSEGAFTFATAINNSGEVAGYYSDGSGPHGFIYDSSTAHYTTLDPSESEDDVVVTAINESGAVSGYYHDDTGTHGFIYDGTHYTPIDVPDAYDTFVFDFNDVGQATGYYDDSTGQHGFIYNSGSQSFTKLDDPSAFGATMPVAINNSGAITGDGSLHGFLAVPN